MTKVRAPLTFAEAAATVAGKLGYKPVGELVARSDRTVYEWANPESGTTPTLEQARTLDAAFLAAGGDCAPFREAYDFQLDLTIERQDACRQALVAEIAAVALEAGETAAAALALVKSNASPLEAHRAAAEAAQLGARVDDLQRRLASFLPDGAGSAAGKSGGNP